MPRKKKDEDASLVPNICMNGEPVMTKRGDLSRRLSTIVSQEKIHPNLAAAVMKAHGLTPKDRMEPARFKSMIDNWLKAPAGGK